MGTHSNPLSDQKVSGHSATMSSRLAESLTFSLSSTSSVTEWRPNAAKRPMASLAATALGEPMIPRPGLEGSVSLTSDLLFACHEAHA